MGEQWIKSEASPRGNTPKVQVLRTLLLKIIELRKGVCGFWGRFRGTYKDVDVL